jgi:hypothetical protein
MRNIKFSTARLGLHYFPDTLHYRDMDLRVWLPELRALGISWIVLSAPVDRAIPEDFVRGLLQAGVEPILHFTFLSDPISDCDGLATLFSAYAGWGVRYVMLFDRPNSRRAWTTATWAQINLVEHFLDHYLPLAGRLIESGLTPIFPPLEPGGDYWDTAFLRAALESMLQRNETQLLDQLILGAYAASHERPLDWGMGGPERWPGARPYQTPSEEQDQCGFCIYDWYRTITQAVINKDLPIMLFGVGSPGMFLAKEQRKNSAEEHAQRNIILAQQVSGNPQLPFSDPLPAEIKACNFWLMATTRDDPQYFQAWYQPDGQTLPVVGMLRQLQSEREKLSVSSPIEVAPAMSASTNKSSTPEANRPIAHYVLLPNKDQGKTEFYLDNIRPFVKKYFPTVGFSDEEAILAGQVTIIGEGHEFPEERVQKLRAAGCRVVRLSGSGMELAHFLATL